MRPAARRRRRDLRGTVPATPRKRHRPASPCNPAAGHLPKPCAAPATRTIAERRGLELPAWVKRGGPAGLEPATRRLGGTGQRTRSLILLPFHRRLIVLLPSDEIASGVKLVR